MNENSFIFKYAVYDLECSVKKPVGAFKTLAEAKRFAREYDEIAKETGCLSSCAMTRMVGL